MATGEDLSTPEELLPDLDGLTEAPQQHVKRHVKHPLNAMQLDRRKIRQGGRAISTMQATPLTNQIDRTSIPRIPINIGASAAAA